MKDLVYYWCSRYPWTHEKAVLASALYALIEKGKKVVIYEYEKEFEEVKVIICTGMSVAEIEELESDSVLKNAIALLDKCLSTRKIKEDFIDFDHVTDITASYLNDLFLSSARIERVKEEISNALNTVMYLSNLMKVNIKLGDFSNGEDVCKCLGLIPPTHPGEKFCEILGFDSKSVGSIKIEDIEKTITPLNEINIDSSKFKEFLEGRAPMKPEYLVCLVNTKYPKNEIKSLWDMQFNYYLKDMKIFLRLYRSNIAQYSGTVSLDVCISQLNQLAGEYLREKNIEVKFGFVTDDKRVCCINIDFVNIFPITIDLNGAVKKDENTEYFSEFYYPD